jgi:hypothetical protein
MEPLKKKVKSATASTFFFSFPEKNATLKPNSLKCSQKTKYKIFFKKKKTAANLSSICHRV